MVEGDKRGKDYEFKSSVKYPSTTVIWHAKLRFLILTVPNHEMGPY